MKTLFNLKNVALFIILACGVALSIRNLSEPDLWWQLRTGEWMMEHGEVAKYDMFSYTHEGVNWVNVKWGFEYCYAWLSHLTSPHIISLIQALVTVIILLSVASTSSQRNSSTGESSPNMLLKLLLLLVVISFRINSRPEMFSYCFAAISLWLFSRYKNGHIKSIYGLIPLQLAWSNFHEGYSVGMVLCLLFMLGETIQVYMFKKNKASLKHLLIACIASLSIVGVNPRGAELYTYPFTVLQQLEVNNFTVEFYSALTKGYYNYAGLIHLAIVLITIATIYNSTKKEGKLNLKNIIAANGLTRLLVLGGFFYISLKANRNIPFFALAGIPFIRLPTLIKNIRSVQLLAMCLAIGLYGMIVSNKFYTAFLPTQRFGMEINYTKTPEGAAHFIASHHPGPHGFVDFLSSSYLLWRLQPSFKTYLDLRDTEIFPATFIKNIQDAYRIPDAMISQGQTLWQFLDSLDHFDYVAVLNNDNFVPLQYYLLHHNTGFNLVYADALSAVFLRNNDHNQNTIEKYGFRGGQHNVFHRYKTLSTPSYCQTISKILNPWYHPIDYQKVDCIKPMNTFYYNLGHGELVNQYSPLVQ